MSANERMRSLQLNGTVACGLLITAYFCGMTLNPPLEKVGQVSLLLWALGLLFWRPWRQPQLSGWDKALFLSFAMFFLVALIAHWAGEGGYEGTKMLGRYARFLLFIPLFLLFRRFATAPWLFGALLLATLATGFLGVLEFSGLWDPCVEDRCFPSVNATINPIQYGSLVLCLTAMMFAGERVYKTWGTPWLAIAWLAAGLGFFSLFASGARGAMVALPLLGLTALVIAWRNGHELKGIALKSLAVIFLIMVSALPSTDLLSQRAQAGVEEIGHYENMPEDRPSSVGTRLQMWRASWLIFRESPWLGVGPGHYETFAQRLYDQGKVHIQAVYRHPHSEYFSVLTTRGLLGLLSLGAVFLVPLLYFWRYVTDGDYYRRAVAAGGLMLVLEMGQAALTESLFRLSSTMGFYIIGVALLAGILATMPSRQVSSDRE